MCVTAKLQHPQIILDRRFGQHFRAFFFYENRCISIAPEKENVTLCGMKIFILYIF